MTSHAATLFQPPRNHDQSMGIWINEPMLRDPASVDRAIDTLADFWSEGFKRYYDELLECYRHIPLDGVGWDEPAVDGDWTSYRYGVAFAKAFETLNGYKLSDKLNLLDRAGMSGETVKVRLDYYRTLNEGVARAQAHLNAKAQELFGKNLISGTHHTWQGEGASTITGPGRTHYTFNQTAKGTSVT